MKMYNSNRLLLTRLLFRFLYRRQAKFLTYCCLSVILLLRVKE